MLKIFLVEDEFVVREGIKNNIDWNLHGYDFCGEASDGELAFPMIQKLKPDIVITDIKMPFMDGLELSRLIKKEFPWIEIIILSGYEEFEYAKEGIKLGVAEYLSKPINGEELLKEIDKVALRIEEKQKELEIKKKYMTEIEEIFLKERMDLFQYLVTGSKTMSELLEMANKLNIELSSMWYNIILFKVENKNRQDEDYFGGFLEMEQFIERIEEKSIILFDRNMEGIAFLIKGDSEDELHMVQNHLLEELKAQLNDIESSQYFGGIGMPVNRLRDLHLSFEKASHAFAYRYLINDNCLIDSSELKSGIYMEKEEFSFADINTKHINREKIKDFLKIGNLSEVTYFVEELFNNLGNGVMKSNMFRQYIMMDIYFCLIDFVEELQIQKEVIETFDMSSSALQIPENSIQYIIRIITQAIELRDKVASNKYGDVIEEAMRYIEENYAQEELSLNTLAAYVNFSPNHLSMIFSQQTGKTFIKFLTDYRMKKAKELLRCTSKRSSVIALEVGYKDPHYFSYLFKKTQGLTPTQYRDGKIPEGEE